MKNILQYIFEASGKPSDLKKYKQNNRTEKVHFKGSDIYDMSDPGYDEDFTYYTGEGNGYIKDKQGKVYDVVTSDSSGDAGYIAGGSHSYYVTIKKANGKDDFYVHGYVAVFSQPRNANCMADIKAGHYLEDYIAKYGGDKDPKFKDIAAKGDKSAKSYNDDKSARIEQKKIDFATRYVQIPESLSWEIVDGQFNFIWWRLTPKSMEELNKKSEAYFKQHMQGKNWGWEQDDPEYQKIKDEQKRVQQEFNDLIQGILRPVLIDKLSKVFKTKDLNKLNGLQGSFGYEKQIDSGKKNFGYKVLGIDTKKKVFVTISTADNKIINDNIELKLTDTINIVKGKASKEMLDLFKKVSDAWKKSEGRGRTEYIKNHWEAIYDKSGGYWGNHSKTKDQAKQEAGEDFDKMVKAHDFDDPYGNNKIFSYSLSLVQVYVEGDMEPEGEHIEKPLENAGPKKERGKDTKISKSATAAAYDKMKAWHKGTRKQNVSNCSDAKLKINYKVCKELGYNKEMDLLKAEADKRGIVIESMTYEDMVSLDNEIL